jgi:hypothetical protein
MRASIDEDDPGCYAKSGINPCWVSILLDGVAQRGVVTADEEQGELIRYAMDRDSTRIKMAADGTAIRETRHGKVEIQLKRTHDGSWPHWQSLEPRETQQATKPVDFSSHLRF